jgi:hypothetical protein
MLPTGTLPPLANAERFLLSRGPDAARYAIIEVWAIAP